MKKQFVLFLFLFLCSAVLAFEQRDFTISGLQCQSLTCEAREGIIPHQLTTIEVSGNARQFAGYSVLMRVVNRGTRTIALERKVGVMANGGFTASIPAYTLAGGQYVFGFVPVNQPDKTFAAGQFTISAAGVAAQQFPATSSTSGSLAGHWYGIAGTMADIVINPDGSYISGGSARGTWRADGRSVVFNGPLAAWNNGRGKLNARGDVIEFYWTNSAGAKQYFVLEKP